MSERAGAGAPAVPAGTGAPALELDGIGKRFPGVVALDDVSLDVRRHEVHAVVGENGAGKSTLLKIVAGLYQPDDGTIRIDGADVQLHDPHDARAKGVSLVPQEILFVPHLSVGRNMLLGLEGPAAAKSRLSAEEARRVRDALDRVGAHFAETTPARDLSVPELRLAQVARALLAPGNVVILDEPTAVLSESDSEHLLERLVGLREQGSAIVYVSHRIGEVMRISDRVTVLRDGRNVGCLDRAALDKDRIVDLMTRVRSGGPAPDGPATGAPPAAGEPALVVRGLRAERRFEGVDLEARPGRLLGIAGVQGSGHGYLLAAIAGTRRYDAGTVALDGRPLPAGSVGAASAAGVLLVPGDRRGAGIVGCRSVRENLVVTRRARAAVRRFGLRWPGVERQIARDRRDELDIRAGSTEVAVGTLSGGNQQKVVLGRALEARPRVLLVDEPTQGIDLNGKAEIRRLLLRFAREQGVAVVVASSDFEELLGLADEICVMCAGRIVTHLDGTTATYREILRHALP